jgi:TnpA family transposase
VPHVLERVVDRDVSIRQLDLGWDQLIRVTASIDGGWTSAVLALERFGAAARADPIHKAGSALGKLLRSLFLCDYLVTANLFPLLGDCAGDSIVVC